MIYSDMNGRRIHRPVKRRTQPADGTSHEASAGDHSSEPEEAAPGIAQEDQREG
jgi:hypothetical protein